MQGEVIKKTIKQVTTTEVVSEDRIIIIPDTGVTYTTKILLKRRDIDLGFFDTVIQSPYYIPYYSSYYGNEIAIGESLLLDENYI